MVCSLSYNARSSSEAGAFATTWSPQATATTTRRDTKMRIRDGTMSHTTSMEDALLDLGQAAEAKDADGTGDDSDSNSS